MLTENRFQALTIQIDNICSQKTDTGVREVLQKLPIASLDELYGRKYDEMLRLHSSARTMATQTFSILLCMQEPLAPDTVLQAVSSANLWDVSDHIDIDGLIDICSNFIFVDSELDVVRFTHLSVQEFLESKEDFSKSLNHERMARMCLNICSSGPKSQEDNVQDSKKSIYQYSVLYWIRHCQLISHEIELSGLMNDLERFLFDGPETGPDFLVWLMEIEHRLKDLSYTHVMRLDLKSVISQNCTPFFTVCIIGKLVPMQRWFSRLNVNCNERNASGTTALYLASLWGSNGIVKFLLEKGADPNLEGGWYSYPLHAACVSGHSEVVQWLLDYGADLFSSGKFSSAFDACAISGNEDVAIRLLSARLQLTQNQYDDIIQQSAYAGFSQFIVCLRSLYGPQFGDFGSDPHRLVERAIIRGHIRLVDNFLNDGQQNSIPENGLYTAALAGKDDMVLYLLQKGQSVEQEGPLGTPLRAATLMGHISTVRVLIEQGVDLNRQSKAGNAAEACAMRGYSAIMTMLIQHEIDVNLKGGLYGTPLQAAAYKGHLEVFQMLIRSGASVFATGRFTNAFYAAVEGGHDNLVDVLLDFGYHFQPGEHRFSRQGYRINRPERERPSDRNYLRFRAASPFLCESTPKAEPTKLENTTAESKLFPRISARNNGSQVERRLQRLTHNHLDPRRKQIDDGYPLDVLAEWAKAISKRLPLHKNHMKLDYLSAFQKAVIHGSLYSVVVICELYEEWISRWVRYAAPCAAFLGHSLVTEFLLRYCCRPFPLHLLNFAISDNFQFPYMGCETHWDSELVKNELFEHQGYEFSRGYDNGIAEWGMGTPSVYLESKTLPHNPVLLETLRAAISGGHWPVFQHILKWVDRAHVSEISSNALIESAKKNHLHIIDSLVHQLHTEFDRKSIYRAAEISCVHENAVSVILLTQRWQELFDTDKIVHLIHIADEAERVEVFQYLINLLPKETRPRFIPAFHILAAGCGCTDTVEQLHDEIKSFENRLEILNQSCNFAARRGHVDTLKLLIQEGADIHAPTALQRKERGRCRSYISDSYEPCTALQAALSELQKVVIYKEVWNSGGIDAKSPREETIVELVKWGANVNESYGVGIGLLPLHFAIRHFTVDTVKTLIEHGADVTSALAVARYRGRQSKEIVSLLLGAEKLATSPNFVLDAFLKCPWFPSTPPPHQETVMIDNYDLMIPSKRSKFDIVEDTPIADIMSDGPGATMHFLLRRLPNEIASDRKYGLLLHMAAVADDVDFVKLLVKRGVDLNAKSCYYGTALQAASRFGHLQISRILLDAGANVNDIGGRHRTAARAAAKGGHLQVLELLGKRGANLNLRTGEIPRSDLGYREDQFRFGGNFDEEYHKSEIEDAALSILHFGIASGKPEIVQYLVDHGVDVNGKSDNGETYLLFAAIHGHWDTMHVLLRCGATFSSPVLLEAVRNNHMDVVKGLLDTQVAAHPLLPSALEVVCDYWSLDMTQYFRRTKVVKSLLELWRNIPIEEDAMHLIERAACEHRDYDTLELLLDYDPLPAADVLPAAGIRLRKRDPRSDAFNENNQRLN